MIEVIGYGSLLNEKSARKTLPGLSDFRLGLVKDTIRIFNKVGVVFFEKYKIDDEAITISSCSTRKRSGAEMCVSIFQCSEQEFELLYEREHRFRWIEVEYKDVNNRLGKGRMCTEYTDAEYLINKCVTQAEYERRVGQYYRGKLWRNDILPFPVYLKYCLESAKQCGPEVLENFLTQSYLADGFTSIKQFLFENEGYLDAVFDNKGQSVYV